MNLQHCQICNNKIISMIYHIHIESCGSVSTGSVSTRSVSTRSLTSTRCSMSNRDSLNYRKIQEEDIKIDNFEDMKNLVQKLAKEVENLKQEVDSLKKNQKRKRISDILKESECHIGFKEWINHIDISKEDVDSILKTNIITGLKKKFDNLLIKGEIPIAAFIQKENKIYLYDNERWLMATRKDIMYMIDILRSKLFTAYSEWPEQEYKKYGKPKYKLDEKIFGMGPDFTDDKISIEIRKFIFTKLKVNLEKDTVDDLEE